MFDHAGFSGVGYLLANANMALDQRRKRRTLSAVALIMSTALCAALAACRGIRSGAST